MQAVGLIRLTIPLARSLQHILPELGSSEPRLSRVTADRNVSD